MKQPILKREGIDAQLHNIFEHPLTVVVAAMGYGKTTSVKNFLEEVKANYAWLSVSDDQNSAPYWKSKSILNCSGKTFPITLPGRCMLSPRVESQPFI